MSNARKVTCSIIQLCEDGVLSWEVVARECMSYMSEYDVRDMAHTASFVEDENDEDSI